MVQRLKYFFVLIIVILATNSVVAFARVDRPVTLSFNPEEGSSERYMTIVTLGGTITQPKKVDYIGTDFLGAVAGRGSEGLYRLRTVFKDEVAASQRGLSRHVLTFYDFDVLEVAAQRRQEEGRRGFGPGGGGRGGRGGGGGGGGGASTQSTTQPISPLPLPPSTSGFEPLQAGPPGGGGRDGGWLPPSGPPAGADKTFDTSKLTITNLEYVRAKNGDILDIGGEELELIQEYSRHAVNMEEEKPGIIKLSLLNVFEWTQLLRLPDYPVWREDIWFATVPVTIPGLRKPIPMNLIYRLIGFIRVGTRELAIIDIDGIEQFHEFWEEETDKVLVKYEGMGSFSIAARYLFDIERGTVFGIERPPMWDMLTMSFFPGDFELKFLEMKFPGLTANLDMKLYTEEHKKKRTKYEKEAAPKLTRRQVALTFIMQTEAE